MDLNKINFILMKQSFNIYYQYILFIESKYILLIQCLPSLLSPSRQMQLNSKKKFKPTIKTHNKESRDAFIANIKVSFGNI